MVLRIVLGIIKGAAIGGGIGYGAHRLGLGPGWSFVIYGVVGLLVGLFVGRPLWSHLMDPRSTIWTGILKGLFGFGVGVGLWALAAKAIGDPSLALMGEESRPLTHWPVLFGPAIGLLYGVWLELDDPAPPRDKNKPKKAD
jgi:hypothetical protein